jgi:16S rRNA C1402 (ribose-2'-O) methylase RsmI
MITKITASTSGMMMAVSRPAVWVSSYAMAGLPPTSAPGASLASRCRRSVIAVVPAWEYGSPARVTEKLS